MSIFWQKWLNLWAWAVIGFGLLLAGAGFAASDDLALLVLDLFGGDAGFVPDRHDRFAIGLMGAVTMGWGMMLLPAFAGLYRLSPADAAPAWRGILVAAAVWYVVDSAISVANGFAINAVSNTVIIALLIVALVRSGALKG